MPNQYTSQPTYTDKLEKLGYQTLQKNLSWINEKGDIVRLRQAKDAKQYPFSFNSTVKLQSIEELINHETHETNEKERTL